MGDSLRSTRCLSRNTKTVWLYLRAMTAIRTAFIEQVISIVKSSFDESALEYGAFLRSYEPSGKIGIVELKAGHSAPRTASSVSKTVVMVVLSRLLHAQSADQTFIAPCR